MLPRQTAYTGLMQKPSVIPETEFFDLETLWFQITGTLCNLRCRHCFISCSPENHSLEMMETDQVFQLLDQAKEEGVKEVYFTGGEPFLHKQMLEILERSLEDFPVSVLTNGLPLTGRVADRLAEIADRSRFSLEVRISIDDYDEERNDAVRGRGTFRRILAAYRRLCDRGFLPILAVTEIRSYLDPAAPRMETYEEYVRLLESIGVDRPRIKVIPIFEMGMLPLPEDRRLVTEEMMEGFDHSLLQCSSSRIAAADGIYACPILVGEEGARMGNGNLEESLRPCSLYHSACLTCYMTGMTCRNY